MRSKCEGGGGRGEKGKKGKEGGGGREGEGREGREGGGRMKDESLILDSPLCFCHATSDKMTNVNDVLS